jgi:hypothetical protein
MGNLKVQDNRTTGVECFMDVIIYAVGSNEILTREIQCAMDVVVDRALPITACPVDQIAEKEKGLLYICNESLRAVVEAHVESKRLAVLNLTPTSTFYMNISTIPVGSRIFIFNNKGVYCKTLENLCKNMGLSGYEYVYLPYEEMSDASLKKALRSAKFIIGVHEILEYVLKSERFSAELSEDARIIGAHRVASVMTANEIVTQLNQLLEMEAMQAVYRLNCSLKELVKRNLFFSESSKIVYPRVFLRARTRGDQRSRAIFRKPRLQQGLLNPREIFYMSLSSGRPPQKQRR